nr:type II secretion system minor pseudopilin GspJ [Marinibactrum halimedae]
MIACKSSYSSGFTLVEVMVALAIGVMVTVLAYQTLSVSITSSEATADALAEIDDLDRAWQMIDRDLRHAISRASSLHGVRSVTGFGTEIDNAYKLKFTRSGRPNPMNLPRSALLRVGYRWEDEVLYRDAWPESQEADIDNALSMKLLGNVTDFQLRFLPETARNAEGPWVDQWPDGNAQNDQDEKMPIAVEVTMEVTGYDKIVRMFSISSGVVVANNNNTAGGNPNAGGGRSGVGNRTGGGARTGSGRGEGGGRVEE